MTRAILMRLSAGAVTAVLWGCGGGSSGTPAPTLVSLSITPANASTPSGLTQAFMATGMLSDGSTRDLTGSVTWMSSNGGVATINSSGVATGVAAGMTTITASNSSLGSASGSVVLMIDPPVLKSIAVTPTNVALELGSNESFTATGTLTDSSTQDVTQAAQWSSSDNTVLLLNNSAGRIGVGNTRGPGAATVTATLVSMGSKGTASVTVTRRTAKLLYASSVGSSTISAFSVDPTSGALTAIGAPYVTTSSPTSIAVTHDFKFLYSADFGGGNVSGFVVEADGSLIPAAGAPLAVSNSPLGVAAHPTADFVYVSTQGSGVTVLSIDPVSGKPTIASSNTLGNAPQFAAMTPDGSHFYQTVSAADQVAGFSVDGTSGALTALPSGSTMTDTFPRAVAIDPAGKYLYAAISDGGTGTSTALDGYTIDPASGALTKIAGSPFMTQRNPVWATIDASGRFLFVANYTASSISVFSINSDTGVLTEILGSPLATPSAPLFVTIDPSGQYLYAGAESATGGVLGFTINQTTGALTANAGANAPGNLVWSIAMAPAGTTANLAPTSLSFGTVAIGSAGPAKTVTLANVGTSTLTISGIAITGTGAGDFVQTDTCGTSLAAGASCLVSVTFKATASGTRTATLSVFDDAVFGQQEAGLSGTGVFGRCGTRGQQCGAPVLPTCCAGLVCSPASTRAFCQ